MNTTGTKHAGFRAFMAIGAVLLIAACSKSSTPAASGGGTSGTTGGSASGTISSSSVGSLGLVLVSADGRTLYLFTPEKGGTPACTGSCASTWPAVLAPAGSMPAVAGGANSSMLGTVKLSGGQSEVTYNGWPLHTYAGDSSAGQANGQGIGGKWFAVTTSGVAAGTASASSPTGSASGSGSSGGASGWG